MTFSLPPKQQSAFESHPSMKSEQLADWITQVWGSAHTADDPITIWAGDFMTNALVLAQMLDEPDRYDGYRFAGHAAVDCPPVWPVATANRRGEIGHRYGAFALRFAGPDGHALEVLVASAYLGGENGSVTLAAVPRAFLPGWVAFTALADDVHDACDESDRVVVVGGTRDSFVPSVDWSDVIMPDGLKSRILNDIDSFFQKGVAVYRRLNLKPFRKLLLAGVPGTGKTMLCNALAKWALDEGILVIYVSGAQKRPNETSGSAFWKIERALNIAASSRRRAIVLLEEMDAYLHKDEKPLLLNVLDGSETPSNPYGTLLIATTNYPEAIDERVLKRPGRLDRIYIVPAVTGEAHAEALLRRYLGSMWQPEHIDLVPQLVGYPGAFVRELAIHALTLVAYDDLPTLTRDQLQDSLDALKVQIEARDELIRSRAAGEPAQDV
jgi:hypothetical protein